MVKTKGYRIAIDPGVALGYRRYGLLPHPFQVAVSEKVKESIIQELKHSTDIIISHFHGDHIPLVHANPFQLDVKKVSDYFKKPSSDIQLLHPKAVSQILNWDSDIVFVSGPPFYLKFLSGKQKETAWRNAVRLSEGVDILIIDHNLLRSNEGYAFLKQIESESGNRVMCAAEFMKRKPLFLEANRELLYKEMPVSEGWHKEYAKGRIDTSQYKEWRGIHVDRIREDGA